MRGHRLAILQRLTDAVVASERARDQRMPIGHALLLVARTADSCRPGGQDETRALGAALYHLTVGQPAGKSKPTTVVDFYPRRLEQIVLAAAAGEYSEPAGLARDLYGFAAERGLMLSTAGLARYLERVIAITELADTDPIELAG
ncbi:MAG: hypothetical protein KJO07_06005 [Deltaproteobacteria bacterium]|nr:hypothetical protein [Deltaproteobacteria bacterium]